MTALTDRFDVTHKKDIKNKQGQVVAQVDYVGWSQSADRLDEALPEGWSFAIMQIGPDWVHGRLTLGDRHFENIGYAENAEAEWKKEVLKDAASDAFKRCAALAGVGRYLYDKDTGPQRQAPPRSAPPVTAAPPRPHVVDTSVPDEPEWLDPIAPDGEWQCPIHHASKLVPAGVSKRTGRAYDAFWACTDRDCKEKAS